MSSIFRIWNRASKITSDNYPLPHYWQQISMLTFWPWLLSHFNVLLAVRLVIIASPELNGRFGFHSDGWTDPDDTKKRVPIMSNISNKFNVIDQSKFRKKENWSFRVQIHSNWIKSTVALKLGHKSTHRGSFTVRVIGHVRTGYEDFHFSWLDNSVIKIWKTAWILFIFNHLKWNPSETFKIKKGYCWTWRFNDLQ